MPSAFRRGAILLTLIATVALTAVHQVGLGPDRIASIARLPPAADTTGAIARSGPDGWIQLSDEQRGWIFLGVMNLTDIPETRVPGLADELGSVLPAEVELQDLPAMVTRKIPLVRHHKFVKLDDRILVVRPTDRVVVSEIPRYRLLP